MRDAGSYRSDSLGYAASGLPGWLPGPGGPRVVLQPGPEDLEVMHRAETAAEAVQLVRGG